MAARREVVKDQFQVQDASGKQYTIIHISEQVDVGGLSGREWMETIGRLQTSEGYAVNLYDSDNFHIVNLGVDVTRV
ncbi:hypothetical protein ACVTTK_02575 [Alcaligenes nematophilus]|nr:hypothetical protein [Alcaligenes faecalis]